MSKVWLIYHGLDHGHSEDCSILYEEPEVFLDESLFKSRKQEIKKLQQKAKQNGHSGFYVHTLELTIGAKIKPRYMGKEYTEETAEE